MQPLLTEWTSFYEIVGTAAATLVGLQFVALSLISARQTASASMREIHAFGSPNVAMFSSVLLMSAVMAAPWRVAAHVGACIAGLSALGVANGVRSFRHARLTRYRPDTSDWVWYIILPLLTHVALGVLGGLLLAGELWAIPGIGALALAFLFNGVHNAWDTVTYAITLPPKRELDK